MSKQILYIGKKLLLFVLSILFLSVMVFWVSRLAPGDPLASYYGDRVEKMSLEERERAESWLGLDQPISVQYIHWLSRAVQGDFGISYRYKMDVTEVIRDRMGNTLLLGGTGFLLIFAGSILLGIFCAWQEDHWMDRLLCRIGTAISCIPEFWLSLFLILLFAVELGWLPSSGAYSIGRRGDLADRVVHLLLPVTVVVSSHLWYYAYFIRNRILEEIRADYVLLERAKGLEKGRILFGHCLPNAFPSYLSMMAISVPHVLGGTYVVETVFSYPGLGTLSYESARYRDNNLLMALCLLSGAVMILCNMAAQMLNQRIDPRLSSHETKERAAP